MTYFLLTMKTFLDLLFASVRNCPLQTALYVNERRITFQLLYNNVIRITNFLSGLKNDFSEQIKVLVLLPKSEYWIYSIYGIVASENIYIPLDSNNNSYRINQIIEAVNPDVIFTDVINRNKIPDSFENSIYIVEELLQGIPEKTYNSIVFPNAIIDQNKVIYIFFTSGTTGNPKGIMTTHKNVNHYINWCVNFFSNFEFDVYLSTSSIGFDLSIMEIFFTLAVSKSIRIIENSIFIHRYLRDVNHRYMVGLVPSVLSQLIKSRIPFTHIAYLLLTGEKPHLNDLIYLKTKYKGMRIWNLYGPTETTVITSYFEIGQDQSEPIPIGKPITNSTINIVDHNFSALGANESGEIIISGDGVALGYLNYGNTNFIIWNGEKAYRTGDFGWKNEKEVFYLKGRRDRQIKRNGIRLELSDIEEIAALHLKVKKAVVLHYQSELLLFVVTENDNINTVDIFNFLKNRIAANMIPDRIFLLKDLALNMNGKVDINSLIALTKN